MILGGATYEGLLSSIELIVTIVVALLVIAVIAMWIRMGRLNPQSEADVMEVSHASGWSKLPSPHATPLHKRTVMRSAFKQLNGYNSSAATPIRKSPPAFSPGMSPTTHY